MSNADILAAVREVLTQPLPDDIKKAFTQPGSATTGLQIYNLEAPAKNLYPVLTPLRNKIARVPARGGIQANWRAVTGINTNGISIGLAEGQRGGVTATATAEYLAAFKFLGLDDSVTFEADYASEGFQDVKALAVTNLLRATMIGEELTDVGGNSSISLGTAATPTLAGSTSGGTLAAQTWSVIVVPLTHKGYWDLAGANNGNTGQSFVAASATVKQTVTRTNADGTSTNVQGYSGQKSAAATVVTTGATSSIGAYTTAIAGAMGYAWFWGAAGSERLGAVTTVNSVSITAAANGAAQLASSLTAADTSTDSLVYDGILTQILKSGSGAYVNTLATGTPGTGTKLTSDGAGGIAEFNTAFMWFYTNNRLSPNVIYVNAQEQNSINKLVVANGGTPIARFVTDLGAQRSGMDGGVRVTSVVNPITGEKVAIETHPNVPPGTVAFWSDMVPYPLSGVGNVVQKLLRRDYYQIEWPLRTRKYEYGVYFDGVLQCYFPPAFGVINNIAP